MMWLKFETKYAIQYNFTAFKGNLINFNDGLEIRNKLCNQIKVYCLYKKANKFP